MCVHIESSIMKNSKKRGFFTIQGFIIHSLSYYIKVDELCKFFNLIFNFFNNLILIKN